jgi:hypothetical protein
MGRFIQEQTQASTKGRFIQEREQAGKKLPTEEFLSGGALRDVFDVIGAPLYAMAGAAGEGRKKAEELRGQKFKALPEVGKAALKGLLPGIKERKSFIDVLKSAKNAEGKPAIKNQKLATGLGFSADLILDPTNLIALGIGKGLQAEKALKGAAGVALKTKPGQTFGRAFIPQFNQPEEYVNLAYKLQSKIEEGGETAVEIGDSLTKGLSQAEQQRLGQIIKGGITSDERLAQIAQPAIDELAKLGKESVEEGLLDADTFAKNFEKYMPRVYREYEKTEAGVKGLITGSKPKRLLLDRFKQRKDIPVDIRKQLGEVLEPGFPVAKGISQLTRDIASSKFFKDVATDFAGDVGGAGLEQLPKVNKLGALSGKYVPKSIADDINEIMKSKEGIEKAYSKALGWWKIGKTVVNPSYHARNLMSNFILNDLGGLSPARADIYGVALKDLATKGSMYNDAKKAGLFGTEFYTNEIKDLLDVWEKSSGGLFNKVGDASKAIARFGGRAQVMSEDWHKLAHFIFRRTAGDSVDNAVKSAKKYLFDYQNVTPFEKKLRTLVPFYTFQRKALPAILGTAAKRPKKISKFGKVQLTSEREFTPQEDLEKERKLKPDYMQQGAFIKLPGKDEFGRSKFLDLTYILPFGDFAEFDRQMIAGRITPFITVPYQVLINRNAFYDSPIWDETDTQTEKSKKILDFMGKSLLPNIAPGSYTWEKVVNAYKKKPDYLGRTRDMATVLFDVLAGLKVTPVDFSRQLKKEKYKQKTKAEELQSKVNFQRKRKDISEEERKRSIAELQEKMRKVRQPILSE